MHRNDYGPRTHFGKVYFWTASSASPGRLVLVPLERMKATVAKARESIADQQSQASTDA